MSDNLAPMALCFIVSISDKLIRWQAVYGRHHLPWQQSRDPYRVWLSEIMLQQTQVDTVIPYYERFLHRFPSLQALAAAPLDDVLSLWSGLGYYARARNLHRAAQSIVAHHSGRFPTQASLIEQLPGIGRSTAAAIASFCFGERAAILDGNVKRVLARCFGIDEYPGARAVEQRMWQLAESLLPQQNIDTYTQALMDLGATVCTRNRPRCGKCPLQEECIAFGTGRQNALPIARPKRIQPLRQCQVLVLKADDKILLEKRPAQGIWGGLFSLPEILAPQDAQSLAHMRFGIVAECAQWQDLPHIQHSFTHFKLQISPILAELNAPPKQINDPNILWANPHRDEIGLPSPIRKLLATLPSPYCANIPK